MRRLLIGVGVLLGVLALALLVVGRLVDPERLREPLTRELSAALGRHVELAALDFSLLPTPRLHLEDLRVAAAEPNAPPLLEVATARVRLGLLPLLRGRVVLGRLELGAPRIRLPLDSEGLPTLPQLGGEAPRASESAAAAAVDEDGAGLALAIESIVILGGELDAGPWHLRNLDLEGRLRADGSADLSLELELAGIARLRDVRVRLTGLATDALSLRVEGQLAELELAPLRAALELEPELAGRVAGRFDLELVAGELRGLSLDLAGEELDLHAEPLTLRGGLALEVRLGGPWVVDLSAAAVGWGEVFHKPAGQRLLLAGELGKEPSLAALGPLRVMLGPNELRFVPELGAEPPRVRLEPARLELEPLGSLLRSEWFSALGGHVRLAAWSASLDPLALVGRAELEGARLELENGWVSLDGTLLGTGSELRVVDVRVRVDEQELVVSGAYDLSSGMLRVEGGTEGADVARLAQRLAGSSELGGTLVGRVSFSGPAELARLSGSGRLEIRQGRIRGFSLLRGILGELVALPLLVARAKGKDLSRYEEEEFQRLAADFRLAEGRLYLSPLILEYRHATAHLEGSVGVLDGSLDLAGRVVIAKEVDAALADRERGREKVIPIAGVRGTVSRPRLVLDSRALASVAATYAGGDRLREKLQEKLGSEGAEAIGTLLDRLLRGGPKAP